MQKVASISKKFLLSFKGIPHKKQYLEFFTALLSIPVLITVIILNYNSLKNLNAPKEDDAGKQQRIVFPNSNNNDKASDKDEKNSGTASPTNVECKKEIGPVDISSPDEGDIISDDPVSVIVDYDDEAYCAVVWAYRINNGRWSDYDDKSIALYNLPKGKIKLELKVKSLVVKDEKTLTRNFIYDGGSSNVSPTPISSVQGVNTTEAPVN